MKKNAPTTTPRSAAGASSKVKVPKPPKPLTDKQKAKEESLAEKAKRIAEARDFARAGAKKALLNWPKAEDVSRLMPSSGQNLLTCPSFFGFEREDQDLTKAEEGTMLHSACEEGIKGEETKIRSRLTPEQSKLVEMCMDYVASIRQDCVSIETERKVAVFGMSNAYIDALVRKNKTDFHVIDYKFGMWPVEDAQNNFQGWAYAEWMFANYPEAQNVFVHFLSPRINEITAHMFTRKDMIKIRRTIGELQSQLTMPPDKRPHIFNEFVCGRCARAYVCPAITPLTDGIANMYREDEMLQLKGKLSFLSSRPSEITELEQMARTFIFSKPVAEWAASVKEHTRQFLLAGHEMEEYGVTLSQKDGSQSLDKHSTALVYALFRELDIEEFLSACDVDLKTLLDTLAARSENPTKAKADALVELGKKGLLVRSQASFYPSIAKDVKSKSKQSK